MTGAVTPPPGLYGRDIYLQDASADETIGAVCGALAAFTGGAEPADDVTVVVVRRV